MALIASEQGKYEPMEKLDGAYIGICCMVADMGTVTKTFKGETSTKRKVFIQWELPTERCIMTIDGEKQDCPRVTGRDFTLSLHENAALFKLLNRWRGTPFTQEELNGFDIETLLGVPGNVLIDDNSLDKVKPLAKGVNVPTGSLEHIKFSYADGDTEMPQRLPKWAKEQFVSTPEWKAAQGEQPDIPQEVLDAADEAQVAQEEPDDSDIPF